MSDMRLLRVRRHSKDRPAVLSAATDSISDGHSYWELDRRETGWLLCDSKPLEIEYSDSAAKEARTAKSPRCAMFTGLPAMADGEYLLQFSFPKLEQPGSAFVGVTNHIFFAGQDVQVPCVAYGGDLVDGTKTLVPDFGPTISEGDAIVMKVNYIHAPEGHILVYFAHNGRSLGLAFDIPIRDLPLGYPAVFFTGNGRVQLSDANLILMPYIEVREYQLPGVSGVWQLRAAADQFPEELLRGTQLQLQETRQGGHHDICGKLIVLGNEISLRGSRHSCLSSHSDDSWQLERTSAVMTPLLSGATSPASSSHAQEDEKALGDDDYEQQDGGIAPMCRDAGSPLPVGSDCAASSVEDLATAATRLVTATLDCSNGLLVRVPV